MSYADRWLLPDGVDEILPAQAEHIEQLRRSLLDLYRCWGYEMVVPPLMEFTDSLLIGLGADVDLLTFKVTDQLSGRQMGIRADMTPQTARMDAHSFSRQGPNRLCYAGQVVYTQPRGLLETRTPIQTGVELYGVADLSADIEVVSLLIETVAQAGVDNLHMAFGHVAIYHTLLEKAGLDQTRQQELFDLLQRKAIPELKLWVDTQISDAQISEWLLGLASLSGDMSVLDRARQIFGDSLPSITDAIDELASVAEAIQCRYPQVTLYFDLSELRGYHYHTGIVFSAYVPGEGSAVGNGGRYDHIGEVFGRARPATGFTANLNVLHRIGKRREHPVDGIYAPHTEDPAQWDAIKQLRQQGERVVCQLPVNMESEQLIREELRCDRQLVQEDGKYRVKSW